MTHTGCGCESGWRRSPGIERGPLLAWGGDVDLDGGACRVGFVLRHGQLGNMAGQHQQCCMLEWSSFCGACCSSLPRSMATSRVPLAEQKQPHNSCSGIEFSEACAMAPDIGMASRLNSTAKQAIQAIASRCRDMEGFP